MDSTLQFQGLPLIKKNRFLFAVGTALTIMQQ